MGLPASLLAGVLIFPALLAHGHPPSNVKRLPNYKMSRMWWKDAVLLALTKRVHPIDQHYLNLQKEMRLMLVTLGIVA